MELTKRQSDELWGVDGPYSEVKYVTEHRILDDSVSRVFVRVEVNINPFTFKIIKKNRKEFADNDLIQALINYSHYLGIEEGYLSIPFQDLLSDESEMEARKVLEDAKETMIIIHKYVMDLIGKPVFNIDIIKD